MAMVRALLGGCLPLPAPAGQRVPAGISLESPWKPAWNRSRPVVDRVSDLVVEWGKPLAQAADTRAGGG